VITVTAEELASANTEENTLRKVALIIDSVVANLDQEIEVSDQRLGLHIQIGVDTLKTLRSTMFSMFGYREPGNLS
jgi:hypothetical protein